MAVADTAKIVDTDVVAEPPSRTTTRLRPPWRPGQSGNPLGISGRSREIESYIARHTADGKAGIDWLLALADGRVISHDGDGKQIVRKLKSSELRYQVKAHEILLDRLFGRAPLKISSTHERRQISVSAHLLAGLEPDTARAALPLLRRLAEHLHQAAAAADTPALPEPIPPER